MDEHERRQFLQDIMRDFAVIGEVHRKSALSLSASAIPEPQKLLIRGAVQMAETAIQKASIILLSWSLCETKPVMTAPSSGGMPN